jgi:hypothetical protein
MGVAGRERERGTDVLLARQQLGAALLARPVWVNSTLSRA